jgi:hypothetical protein
LFETLRFASDPIELKLIEVNSPPCSSPILAWHDNVLCLCNGSQAVIDDVMQQLDPNIEKTDGPPITRLVTGLSPFVEEPYGAIQDFIS